jgi:hypothetical protein
MWFSLAKRTVVKVVGTLFAAQTRRNGRSRIKTGGKHLAGTIDFQTKKAEA